MGGWMGLKFDAASPLSLRMHGLVDEWMACAAFPARLNERNDPAHRSNANVMSGQVRVNPGIEILEVMENGGARKRVTCDE
jgi:hypothetical protein